MSNHIVEDGAMRWEYEVPRVVVSLCGEGHVLCIYDDRGEPLVTVAPDGSVEYGEGYEPNAVARRFWEAMASIDHMREAFLRALGGVGMSLEDNNLAVPHISNLTTRKGNA